MPIIEISQQTYDKIRGQLGEEDIVEINDYKDMIGKKFFFRTVTYHLVGEVVKKLGNFLQLEGASWIADSGRFMQCIKEGTLNEVEPVGTVFVNLETVVDFYPWRHALPTKQK
jgi:hypothetical protein